ncbi:YadA-like family protein, partial [Providencia rettgeri]
DIAVNKTNISSLDNRVSSGVFSISANNGDPIKVAENAVIDFSNVDSNLAITQKGTKFDFSLKDNLSVNKSIKIGEKTNIDSKGITIDGGPKFTSAGISAGNQVIGGVNTGVADTDAVNVAQLRTTANELDKLSVKYDGDINNPNYNQITLVGSNGTTIKNLSNGAINELSSDAINGSQIYANNKSIASFIGGGASFNNEGWVKPTFTMNNGTTIVNNISDAITYLDSKTTDNTSDIKNIKGTLDEHTQKLKDQDVIIKNNSDLIEQNRDLINGVSDNVNVLTIKTEKNSVDIAENKNNIAKNTSDINDLKKQKSSPLQYDESSKSITMSSDLDTKEVSNVSFSHNGEATLLKSVADGKVEANSKDAVNGGQLYNTQQMIVNNNERINNVEKDVTNLKKQTEKGFAQSAAINGLFQPYGIGKYNFTAAVGGYGSTNALAIGTGYRLNESVAFKAGVSIADDNRAMYNVGVNMEW